MSSEVESNTRARSTRTMRTTRGLPLRDVVRRDLGNLSILAGRSEVEEARDHSTKDPGTLAALNVGVAIVLLSLTAPLMLVVAVLVRLTSRGPVFFSQERVGLDRRTGLGCGGVDRQLDLGGRPVRILKFRTMYFERRPTDQVWTQPNDARITRLGKLLRSHRIDELPQLINVLKREMNVVGPRPEQPEIFSRLRERHRRFASRQRVLPGITGLAQVECGYGGGDFQVKRKLECDLEYVERRDLRMDLEILLRTIPVVLLKRGAR